MKEEELCFCRLVWYSARTTTKLMKKKNSAVKKEEMVKEGKTIKEERKRCSFEP
jgi:hypothetical protein